MELKEKRRKILKIKRIVDENGGDDFKGWSAFEIRNLTRCEFKGTI